MTMTRRAQAAPGYRTYVVTVARTERLGPSFARLTFTGVDLGEFGVAGDDQRVKLMLPQPGRDVGDIPSGEAWYAAWKALPDEIRPTMRTYTVRAFRPAVAELDIDVVLHGVRDAAAGPVAAWAAADRVGDRVGLVGPDRPGNGRMWGCEWAPPPAARQLLLAGDETAAPAIGAIVESLPRDRCGVACIEVPSVGDVQRWEAPRGVDVRWLVRRQANRDVAHGALLEAALTESLPLMCGGERHGGRIDLADTDVDSAILWEVPDHPHEFADNRLYAWLAGEAGVIRRLRRLVVNEHRVPRSSVAFMGYWRLGRSELT